MISEEEKIKKVMMQCPVTNGQPIQPKPGPNYICHRCGEHGHFIKYCPTNGNPNFDAANRRTMRPSGIPTALIEVIHSSNTSNEQGHLWETSTGQYARLVENIEEFRSAVKKVITKFPDELACNLCKNPPVSAVLTRCCNLNFCYGCISQQLVPPNYVCPTCKSEREVPHELISNYKVRELAASLQSGKINTK